MDRKSPVPWDRKVVVYLLDDEEVLEPIGLSSSGDYPGHFAGAVVPLFKDEVDYEVATTRVVLSPYDFDARTASGRRLLRHELTHEAMGFEIADDAWFAEGIATYVEHADLPRSRWPITRRDIGLARRGVDGMPQEWEMYGSDLDKSAFSYALSMMACDYIVTTQGPETLARLYSGMAGIGPDAQSGEQERVYRRVLGIGSDELARRAAKYLATTTLR